MPPWTLELYLSSTLQDGCEEKFALTSERNKHMDAVHEKTIPCNHCDKKFYGVKEAEAHVTRWHTDDGTPRVSRNLTASSVWCLL